MSNFIIREKLKAKIETKNPTFFTSLEQAVQDALLKSQTTKSFFGLYSTEKLGVAALFQSLVDGVDLIEFPEEMLKMVVFEEINKVLSKQDMSENHVTFLLKFINRYKIDQELILNHPESVVFSKIADILFKENIIDNNTKMSLDTSLKYYNYSDRNSIQKDIDSILPLMANGKKSDVMEILTTHNAEIGKLSILIGLLNSYATQ